MKRFELTFGPVEFEKFDNAYDCTVDMQQRLMAMAYQEGYRVHRIITCPAENEPKIRMVAIASEL